MINRWIVIKLVDNMWTVDWYEDTECVAELRGIELDNPPLHENDVKFLNGTLGR
jgi:hypothetical protein